MVDGFPLQALIDKLFPLLAMWLIVGARFAGFAMVFPLFSWLNLSPLLRAGFAAAMAAPIALQELTAPTFAKTLTAWDLTALMSKEIFVGLLIGLIAAIPFWAAQTCGELIDTYRGSSAGALFDPSLTTETSELGVALMLAALAMLMWSGGAIDLIRHIYLSFQVWPAHMVLPKLQLSGAILAAGMVAKLLLMGVGFAAAALMCLFAIDLALALMGRATRQVQLFDISMALKNLGLVLLLPLLGGALITIIGREVAKGSFSVDILRQMIPAVVP